MKAMILAAALFFMPIVSLADGPKYSMVWEMAHERDTLEYGQQLERFGRRLKDRSGGRLELTVRRSSVDGPQAMYEATNRVYRGEVQFSQIRIGDLTYFSPSIGVMTAPFLFENHAHAARVMDGSVGRELLRDAGKGSREKLHAFAFTYSGGFRQISGRKKIQRVEDLKGFRLLQPAQKTALEYFDEMGAAFTGSENFTPDRGIVQALASGEIDGTETEYVRAPRLDYEKGKIEYVNETNHALYLTVIVGNGPFVRGLPSDLRKILEEEIQALAAEEREFSIHNESIWRDRLIKMGIKIVVPSKEEQKRFISATKPLYQHYQRTTFGPFLKRIQALRSAGSVKLANSKK